MPRSRDRKQDLEDEKINRVSDRQISSRGAPDFRMASYILRAGSVAVPWMTLLPLSMAASWADSAVVDDGASSLVGVASKIYSGGTCESLQLRIVA